jgi:hypothetical protein
MSCSGAWRFFAPLRMTGVAGLAMTGWVLLERCEGGGGWRSA